MYMCVCVFEQEGHMSECAVNKDEIQVLWGDKAKRVCAGSGIWSTQAFECVCMYVCVCARVSVLTHLLLNHKSIVSSWLFLHHITPISPLHKPPAFSTSTFGLCVFPRSPPSTAHSSTLRYAGVNCACSSFLWLLPSSKTNPKVNQFSSTTSPITECITMLSLWTTNCFERATLWPTMLCSSQNSHFNLQSAFVNKMKNLNSAGYTPIENIAYALAKIIGLNNIVIKQLIV